MSSGASCPVDHSARSTWGGVIPPSSSSQSSSPTVPQADNAHASLPTSREVSSIPRTDGERWVYPSQAQFFAAMARKQHNPQASDMPVVVPIHNAVNERAWSHVMDWEAGRGGDQCGGVKLVSFKGKPGEMSLKARWRTLLGYQRPFDRHDWVIDRCGVRMRYIIDFYTGRRPEQTPGANLSFFLDVRPAFDNWEGVKMRAERFWDRWFGKSAEDSPSSVKTARPSARH